MTSIVVIGVCLVLFLLWMKYELDHAEILPPDYDYDKEFDEALKRQNNN